MIKNLTHSDYTVALLCPLEVEMSALRFMLDEEHDRLRPVKGDTNQYIFGQLSGHNVVIASLPAGYQGTVSAATVARNLDRTFPSLELRLLVGIGGGVPSCMADIRLGDVVVSVPSGTQGGVVQYDLGKQTATGFCRKGFLCPPPTEWLTILPRIQSDHLVRPNRVKDYISAMLEKHPMLIKYGHPGPDSDILFQPDYHHRSSRTNCEDCDPEKVVSRAQRPNPDQPVIHYGLIASGDRVMKNAMERDTISNSSEGAICFEMEAAGLMNDFRCIVIRGICDYADSHKNDVWQPYAAAVAAGLAKEFLSYFEPSHGDRAHVSLKAISTALKEAYTGTRRLEIQRISGQLLPMSQCYINLTVIERSRQTSAQDAQRRYRSSLFARLKIDTDNDEDMVFLESLFRPRKLVSGQIGLPKRIQIEGRAGVGKTTLCKKIVHEYVHQGLWGDQFDLLLWVPLRKLKGKSLATTTYNFEQLFYDEYFSMRPDGKDMAETLWTLVSEPRMSQRILFLLDGLDEVSREWDMGAPMNELLHQLLRQSQVIITSRPHASYQTDVGPLDLELEAVGFRPIEVDRYLSNVDIVRDPEVAKEIRDFLESHELMNGLVRIPIQLDALCYSWDRNFSDVRSKTMTGIYQAITSKLWKKDILRLEFDDEYGKPLTEAAVQDIVESDIGYWVRQELNLIEGLAFHGLCNNIIEFGPEERRLVHNKLRQHGTALPPRGEQTLRKISFLRASDESHERNEQRYHFLHLTFQEFFAAEYFVRQWLCNHEFPLISLGGVPSQTAPISPLEFLRKEKYNQRFDIFWRFVTGIFQLPPYHNPPSGLKDYFNTINAEPRDLVGRRHATLLVNCLSEVESSAFDQGTSEIKSKIEDQLKQVILSGDSLFFLCTDADFPSHVLTTILERESEDIGGRLLGTLAIRGKKDAGIIRFAARVLDRPAALELKHAAIGFLCSLYPESMTDKDNSGWMKILKGDDQIIAKRTIAAICQQSNPSRNLLCALIGNIKDAAGANEEIMSHVFKKDRDHFSYGAIRELITIIEEDSDLSEGAAMLLIYGANHLPTDNLRSLSMLLRNQSTNVRLRAAKVLRNQEWVLKNPELNAIIDCLQGKDGGFQSNQISIRQCQRNIPVEILHELLGLLRSKAILAEFVICRQWVPPDAILTELCCLLEDDDYEVRRFAAEALEGEVRIPDILLHEAQTCPHAPAKESLADKLAVFLTVQANLPNSLLLQALQIILQHIDNEALSAISTASDQAKRIPKYLLHDLTLCLGDEGSSSYTRSLISYVIRAQLESPGCVLSVLGIFLKSENIHVRDNAIKYLYGHKRLPEWILRSLIFVLENDHERTRHRVSLLLGDQAHIPADILDRLCIHLKDEIGTKRLYIANVLARQTGLPDETLHDLTLLAIEYLCKGVRRTEAIFLAGYLSQRTDLPASVAEPLKLCLERGSDYSMVILENQCFFYRLIPDLNAVALRLLFDSWLHSLEAKVCYLWDGDLFIDNGKETIRQSFESDRQRERFIQGIRQVQKDLSLHYVFPFEGKVENGASRDVMRNQSLNRWLGKVKRRFMRSS